MRARLERGIGTSALVVGLGARSRDALVPALSSAGVPIGYVHDRDPARAEDFARLQEAGRVPEWAVFSTELPTRVDDFRIAVLATPHDSHYALTRRLVAAGLWVLKEKPLARDHAEASALVRECGSQISILVERPHLEPFQLAARLLDAIGEPVRYEIRYWRTPQEYRDTWRNDFAQAGGGALLDLGYHVMDVVVRLWGPPVHLSASRGHPDQARHGYIVEEDVRLRMRHRSPCVGSVHISRVADAPLESYEVIGSEGVLRFNKSTVTLSPRGGPPKSWTYPVNPLDHTALGLRGALDLVGKPEAALAEARHGVQVMDVIAQAYDALADRRAQEGRTAP
ncbi:Gfo/Idh/MocA family oxidoreductase [Actinosynnema sp. NPDC023658]|uniref:Gfo/Idh/MocA family protein n=1 Tax=Actinosynnema sp. NPDC023658 TaxID=3155465 RepID=UPI0033CCED1A